MKQKISVFGNTPPLRNGQIIAADLSLAGYDVNLLRELNFKNYKEDILDVDQRGLIYSVKNLKLIKNIYRMISTIILIS